MLFVHSRKKIMTKKKKKKKKKKKNPIFFEHVTPSAVPRLIFILLTQYGHPISEPNFLKI